MRFRQLTPTPATKKIKECAQTLVMNGLRGHVRLQAAGPKKSPFCLKVLPHPFFSLPFSINMNQRLPVWQHINIGTIDTATKQATTGKRQ